jgi:hypothetical protein
VGTPVSFKGLIQNLTLFTDGTKIPIGSLISGTYINNKDKIAMTGGIKIVSLIQSGNGYAMYTINNAQTLGTTIQDADQITMSYKTVTTELVTTELVRDANVS